jgi:hypothetical protein
MANARFRITYCKCPDCSNIFFIPRSTGRRGSREDGHKKDIWCIKCKRVTTHIEYKQEWKHSFDVKRFEFNY